jgi:hypothetical protein
VRDASGLLAVTCAFGAVNQTRILDGDSETHTLKGPSDATWAKPTGSSGRRQRAAFPQVLAISGKFMPPRR